MALPDISNLSVDELLELVSKANTTYLQKQQEEADEDINRKLAINQAIVDLETLLGPANSPPGETSIRAVRAYGDAIIEANPGKAAVLSMLGLEILTETILDIAKVVAKS